MVHGTPKSAFFWSSLYKFTVIENVRFLKWFSKRFFIIKYTFLKEEISLSLHPQSAFFVIACLIFWNQKSIIFSHIYKLNRYCLKLDFFIQTADVGKFVRAEGQMDGLFKIEPMYDIPSSVFNRMHGQFFSPAGGAYIFWYY